MKETSWESVHTWYQNIVGEEGHYYHQHVVLPGIMRLLELNKESKLVDLACGEGILARKLPPNIPYKGYDAAKGLIKSAQERDKSPKHLYEVADITQMLPQESFTHATVILALQNVEHPERVFENAARLLPPGGKFLMVINHPSYRIPRQSGWGIDEARKIQYRRIDGYMSPMQIPLQANPGKGKDSETVWSFHFPLSFYSKELYKAGFAIEIIEEWCSNKESTGRMAKMENRSRQEFPLFMAIRARRL